ncbi:hypothetical protein ACMU_04170 [Actibacterium mucosum KCTC 23349]|uniref:Methyltransferase domain-containing protein n=1 Tax=Actibacterium mucosum KCTC 23349 TaxID=1454373 RepID=A0A037ZC78_9RHOB|nr:hypothetical protein ACMU_04170 [Actibacterium mucosum KCTC 23349]
MRPALDLLAQVPPLPKGDVIDLGCGSGAMGPALANRFGTVTGIDNSPAMLTKAEQTGAYGALAEANVEDWAPETPPALIYSNALLHWLPDHAELFPKLARMLGAGGVLAVQMPVQFDAPSHALSREIAAQMFPQQYRPHPPQVSAPQVYFDLLDPLGDLSIWRSEYLQILPADAHAHPVRRFTESTALRPVLDALNADQQARFLSAYDDALHTAYPLRGDGRALLPFARLFMVLRRDD